WRDGPFGPLSPFQHNNGSLTLTIGYGPCARAVKAARNGSGRGWVASTEPPWRRPAIVPERILLAVSICVESFAVDYVSRSPALAVRKLATSRSAAARGTAS